MSVLIIFTSSTPLSPFHLYFFFHLAHTPGSLRWPFREQTEKGTPARCWKLAQSLEGLLLPLLLSLSVLLVYLKPHRPSESVTVCVCVFNFHKLRFRLKWLAWGWWSVALPSSLSCWPRGGRTNTRSYRDTISQAYEHAQKHVDTLRPWDRQCPGLVYVCLPVSRWSSW